MTLAWILGASVAGGTLSAGARRASRSTLRATLDPDAGVASPSARCSARRSSRSSRTPSTRARRTRSAFAILGGIFGFFVLEKLLLWRHCHTEHCEAHDQHAHVHDHGRSGALIVVGDTVHNFVDGVLIAAAFLQSTELGIVAAVAIIAHEIPQEVGDFLILLHSGYSRAQGARDEPAVVRRHGRRRRARLLRPAGAARASRRSLLGIVAASMIYVAVADLIPGLHRRPELRDAATQTLLIALGIGAIALVRAVLAH